MSIHDPDQIPSLDEILGHAPVSVRFWLAEAESAIDEQFGSGYAERHPTLTAGFMSACAAVYQAERQIDAAERIATCLLAVVNGTAKAGDDHGT